MAELSKRRIRIQGKPDDTRAFFVTITDMETGEPIDNVVFATIYLDPRDVCKAVLTYDETDKNGQVIANDGVTVERSAEVENPVIDITAYGFSVENKL